MPVPMIEVRRTELPAVEKLPAGLDGLVHRAHGGWKTRRSYRESLEKRANRAHAEAAGLAKLSAGELRELVREGRQALRRGGKDLAELFNAGVPVIAELARRALGLTAYPVQIMGALGIGDGRLVEMATGEGKTLTIALGACVFGWRGRPVHIITANDYLAQRDADTMRAIYEAAGLKVASVTSEMKHEGRQKGHAADIVYTTSKELVADFLRDRLILGPLADPGRRTVARLVRQGEDITSKRMVLRGLHTAIVDEADNQLIDEAVTPLIISQPQENEALIALCRMANQVAAGLLPGQDYEIDVRHKEVKLLDQGRERIAEWCAEDGRSRFSQPVWVASLAQQALQARHFFVKDKQYVVVDGEVIIVDESTGRLMPGRSWRLGLHQAVEAKEGLDISSPSESLARLSFQRFFRLFRKLAGVTGTGAEAAAEFWRIYELPVVKIHTHRPCIREVWPKEYYGTASEKWAAVVAEIEQLHALGRPILVGTRSVAASEHLGRLLTARGLTSSLLNAVRHEHEAAIILGAGESRAITVATNMAGRGTDIRLGQGVKALGGLHVILTEMHESGRVDRQLQGRAARQGDPGSTRTFLSMEDDLVERFVSKFMRKTATFSLGSQSRGSVGKGLARALFGRAQSAAERSSFRQRRMVLEQDQELSRALIPGQSVDQI
jgi:preprotein translocase subunit SecA